MAPAIKDKASVRFYKNYLDLRNIKEFCSIVSKAADIGNQTRGRHEP